MYGHSQPAVRLQASRTSLKPVGWKVNYVSKSDVRFLFKEIFQDRVHLRHGIQLSPGGVVVDVGANIGIFAAFAAQRVGKTGLVLACEPLPATYAALEANAKSHKIFCASKSIDPAEIVPINAGVGDGSSPTATFTLYERAAGWGTMRPSEEEVLADMGVFLRNALQHSGGSAAGDALSAPAKLLGGALRRWAPAWLYDSVWRWAVLRMLGAKQEHQCAMCTLSDIIHDRGLTRVDLLKVDVERAEVEVLRGVSPPHWPLVQQAVLEVHQVNLEEVLGVVREQGGFQHVVVDQDDALKGSSLYMVYCLRDPPRV